jgi:hypothetical protein
MASGGSEFRQGPMGAAVRSPEGSHEALGVQQPEAVHSHAAVWFASHLQFLFT